MQVTQIKDQFRNIDIVLDRSDTIWNQFRCIRSKNIHIPLLTHLPNDARIINIVYGIRILIATIAIVVSAITTNIIIYGICGLVWSILVLILLFDCNYSIFLDGISTFDVYYKVINMGIGVLGQYIALDWFYSDWDPEPNKYVLYTISGIIIFANMMVVLVVSLFDGYHSDLSKVKFFIVAMFVLYHCYRLIRFSVFYPNKNSDVIYFAHKYTLDWEVAAMSSTFSTLAFVCKQFFQGIITKRATVVSCSLPFKTRTRIERATLELETQLLPTQRPSLMSGPSTVFTKSDDSIRNNMDNIKNIDELNQTTLDNFNAINKKPRKITSKMHLYRSDPSLELKFDASELSEEIGSNTSVSTMAQESCDQFNIAIDRNVTLLYALLYYACGIKDESKLTNICNTVHNVWFLWFLGLFVIGYLILNSIINLFDYGWVKVSFLTGCLISALIMISSMNYQIFCYQIATFVVWWKVWTAIQLYIGMTLMDKKNDENAWNENNQGYNIIQSYYDAIINFILVCFVTTISLSTIEAITFLSMSKWVRIIVRNLFIVLGIFYFGRWALEYGEIAKGNYFISLSIGGQTDRFDMKHIVVLKAIDLLLWFSVQLVRQIRFQDTVKWQRITLRLE